MKNQRPLPTDGPLRLTSPAGLAVEINSNGSLRRMDHGDIILNLFLGNEMEGGPANIWLRRVDGTAESIPLLGPASPASFSTDGTSFSASGRWRDLVFRVSLVLAESKPAWFWHVEVENEGTSPLACDLIHTQDLAIAHYGAVRLNEYYVSQYVDHTPLEHASRGCAVASRQNLSMRGCCPWTLIGSLGRGTSYATDALQFHGLATREGVEPIGLASGLPGLRRQHEHSMAAIQDEAFILAPGSKIQRGFFGWFETDKTTATSVDDVSSVNEVLALPEAAPPQSFGSMDEDGGGRHASLFVSAPLFKTVEPDETAVLEFFGGKARHEERENGELLSFFTGDASHVVLKAKELETLRPHGHLLRSGGSITADESALTSTAWMGGVFHSMITQGHVSINRFLSTCHTYLGLFRSHGQRVFVEIDGAWQLLDQPSAFEMAPDSCRWLYKHRDGLILVRSLAPDDRHELQLEISVLDGPATRFLISHHVAMNGDDGSSSVPALWERDGDGVFVKAVPDSDVGRRFPDGGFRIQPLPGMEIESIGNDSLLFADGISRNQPYICFVTAPCENTGLMIEGCLVPIENNHIPDFWKKIDGGLKISAPNGAMEPMASRLTESFPWLIHNALVHYLSPRGLEQYSGGGWGTRDVCQGPVELLLALGHFDAIRDLLLRVFRQQNADGDWPQWFMFFDRERNIRPEDSHGDIVYWPVLALAQYLSATGDATILDENVPYFGFNPEAAEKASVLQHVDRALELIRNRVIPGTRLAAYGHGDWNDSLQPVKPDMRERLCSSWTVTLNYQTLVTLAEALQGVGMSDRAADLEGQAAVILDEFQRILIVDQVVAGLAYFQEEGTTELLLHPRDGTTGLSYSVLPMIHAIINDMFTHEQAAWHLGLIHEHLLGPDGAHLFNRPIAYHGGPQSYFQRAESASFFGREIGIMYTHAHLRYCEALARFGDTEAFFKALCRVNPIAIRELVPSATMRQANCYYSSSDPAFHDRYEAFNDYDRVKSGEVPLEGGWRVYSSGAGIGVRLIMQCFLGLRVGKGFLFVDPAMPTALDGMSVAVELAGRAITVTYRIEGRGCGPESVILNGNRLPFVRERNPYRAGGVRIAMGSYEDAITGTDDRLEIHLG